MCKRLKSLFVASVMVAVCIVFCFYLYNNRPPKVEQISDRIMLVDLEGECRDIDLCRLDFGAIGVFCGNMNNIISQPYGTYISTFIIFKGVGVDEYYDYQVAICPETSQAYYRYVDGDVWTNWISLDLLQIDSDQQFGKLDRDIQQKMSTQANDNTYSGVCSCIELIEAYYESLSSYEDKLEEIAGNDKAMYDQFADRCIVSFVDDDSGVYVHDIWGEIIDETNIRMGFACITGFITSEEMPEKEEYIPMDLDYLMELYKAGHDVYSHSYTHPFFYEVSTSIDEIESQSESSRNDLLELGFSRCADIIVYPGGLGQKRISKKEAARGYYRYGVDTVGGGMNGENIDSMCIYRYNMDTASIEEIKNKIDEANEQGSMLVFMAHAYELNKDYENQKNKVLATIRYLQEMDIAILPLSQALKITTYYNNASDSMDSTIFDRVYEILLDFRIRIGQ